MFVHQFDSKKTEILTGQSNKKLLHCGRTFIQSQGYACMQRIRKAQLLVGLTGFG